MLYVLMFSLRYNFIEESSYVEIWSNIYIYSFSRTEKNTMQNGKYIDVRPCFQLPTSMETSFPPAFSATVHV